LSASGQDQPAASTGVVSSSDAAAKVMFSILHLTLPDSMQICMEKPACCSWCIAQIYPPCRGFASFHGVHGEHEVKAVHGTVFGPTCRLSYCRQPCRRLPVMPGSSCSRLRALGAKEQGARQPSSSALPCR
jgi:hypothetical protein